MQIKPQSRLHPTYLENPPLAPKTPSAPETPQEATPKSEWQPRKDLMNQMLAYRDWWNMPSRRAPRRAARPAPRPLESGRA